MPLDAVLIAELVDRHGAALVGFAQQTGATAPEDVVQEAFCRLVAQARIPQQPAAWLYRVVRNLIREQARHEARRQKRERAVAVPETMACRVSQRAEAQEALEKLGQLPPELRDIVLLRLWSDLSLTEIATACDISVATAHRRWQAALEQLHASGTPTWTPRPAPTSI